MRAVTSGSLTAQKETAARESAASCRVESPGEKLTVLPDGSLARGSGQISRALRQAISSGPAAAMA